LFSLDAQIAQRRPVAGTPGQLGPAAVLTSGFCSTRSRMRLQRGKAGIAMHTRARQIDALVERNAPILDQHHAVGQGHGLLHIVRDQQGREAMAAPQTFDEAVHLDARQRIESAQRLIEQQSRLVNQGTGQGYALALAARQPRRPFVFAVSQSHLRQHLAAALACRIRQPRITLSSTRFQGSRRAS
jgi:hypothetical protein